MRAYLLNIWDDLRYSFWFVPAVSSILALVLSVAAPQADQVLAWELPEWALTTTNAARATVSMIAGAMIATTGTVFSITIVALSLASQQFGPRLLRRFMQDVPTQLTLGVFLATGFYALLILRVVEKQEEEASALHLSVLTAVSLAVLSMATLIYFIHHVAILIQAPHVVAAVAADLDHAFERLYPAPLGQADGDAVREPEPLEALLADSHTIKATDEGYVQAISGDDLVEYAAQSNAVIHLRARPGDFVSRGAVLATAAVAESGAEPLRPEELSGQVNEAFIFGIRRTPRQDIECALDELVEVAVRALSPGVNDPFTASSCVDRLGAALGRFAELDRPSPYRWDEEGRLRLIAHPVDFPELLDAAFDQIRRHGRDNVSVTIRLLQAFASIGDHVQRAEDREALLAHARMVASHADAAVEERDARRIREEADRLLDRLAEPQEAAAARG